MNDERRETALKLRVGVFVLLALAVFLGVIYALGARARLFEARYTIHAEFVEVGGLTEGATVRLAGVQIGRVSGVSLPVAPGGKVRVDLDIAKQFADRIRRDSVARIETQGLLGDKIVEVTVGTGAVPAVRAGETLAAREPTDVGRMLTEGADAARSMAALVAGLREAVDSLNRVGLIDKLGRVADRVEQGPGWAHTLVYEDPVVLRRLEEVIMLSRALIEQVRNGRGPAGVLLSPEGTAAAQRFVSGIDRVGRLLDRPEIEHGLLAALLFESKHRSTLEDLGVFARSLRGVSERVAEGQGALGVLLDAQHEVAMREALADLRLTLGQFKMVGEKLNAGEGTLGALLADPTIYERLVAILEGAQRSFLLRSLIRGLGSDSGATATDGAPSR